jgi:hypothetical protein
VDRVGITGVAVGWSGRLRVTQETPGVLRMVEKIDEAGRKLQLSVTLKLLAMVKSTSSIGGSCAVFRPTVGQFELGSAVIGWTG